MANKNCSVSNEVQSIDVLNREYRVPSLSVIDLSGSMTGAEALLKKCLEGVYDAILADPTAKYAVELGVISFNSDVHIHENLREIRKHEARGNIDFSCEGCTLLGLAVKTAIDQIEERLAAYRSSLPRVHHYAPIMFILSDGAPYAPNNEIAAEEAKAMEYSLNYIRKKVTQNQLVVFTVEIGNQCNHELLRQLTGLDNDSHVLKVDNDADLANFFTFTSSLLIRCSLDGSAGLNKQDVRHMHS